MNKRASKGDQGDNGSSTITVGTVGGSRLNAVAHFREMLFGQLNGGSRVSLFSLDLESLRRLLVGVELFWKAALGYTGPSTRPAMLAYLDVFCSRIEHGRHRWDFLKDLPSAYILPLAVSHGITFSRDSSMQNVKLLLQEHFDEGLCTGRTNLPLSKSCIDPRVRRTNTDLPPSPALSPRLGPSLSDAIFPFDPLLAKLTDSNSVVLPTSKTALYLDNALTALDLPVEVRTSFITYWLPSILKHDFVALCFLPQASYEHAAPLDIEPKPDAVTRVFMLFKRVCDDELDEWEGARSRAAENVEIWKDVVGAEYDRMRDEALFTVLEWGGMEVKK
ncbi:hypothetical protein ARMSODRAFT_1064826 [Armillaria solidipes]|uniref:Uncharacterized protein n=1 Tax=Armillaria solidipes TaxID=1076256 RepID=A0A2H3ARG9_9AGAR|nr:hypothetical protein ARMSODRAFT_1064826 [Armillaria solidipes]